MNWKDIYNKHKKAIWIGVAGLLALLLILFLADYVSDKWNKNKIEKALQEVKEHERHAANILTNIHSDEKERIAAQANVNAAKANLNTIREEVNEAQEIANQALENINALANVNFNNITADAANAARCRAFPDSTECRR